MRQLSTEGKIDGAEPATPGRDRPCTSRSGARWLPTTASSPLAQARDCGLTTTHIAHLVRDRRARRRQTRHLRRRRAWNALDEDRGRTVCGPGPPRCGMTRAFVASHDSSAHEHGLEILNPPDPHVHITRPGSTNAWTEYGVKHHLARFRLDQVSMIDGLDVLDLARTAVDIAREHGEPYGEIACDAAMRLGVTRSALEDACAIMLHWPHHRRTERAVAFARAEAANLAETLTRILVEELALGETDPQFPVRLDSGRVAWADVRVNRHLFESLRRDQVLRPPEAGGVAQAPAYQVVRDAKRRDIELRTRRPGHVSPHVGRPVAAAQRAATKRLTPHRVRRHRPQVRHRAARAAGAPGSRAARSAGSLTLGHSQL